jgi:adhesin transport system outer membrane protein
LKKSLQRFVLAGLLGALVGVAQAERIDEVVGRTVIGNPDVLAKWHQFKASGFERDVSWGRNLPTLDMVIGVGSERREPSALTTGSQEHPISSSKITLKQNLFEGFATLHDTKRLEHTSVVRFYEFLDVSETAALEAARAYVDLYRHRKLLEMAEDNYAIHRVVFDSIDKRVKAGVGRGVDLEIASGRLALAESNLLTEASNVHDVTARFQRVVGDLPKGDIEPPSAQLAAELPKTRAEAIQSGFQGSPQLKAAVEVILAAQRNVALQRAGYYPKVDWYAESSREKNADGILGNSRANIVGFTVSINLFRGRQDSSRVSKAAADASAAKDDRERVCRDLRQNLSVAYNDHLRLTEQLAFLDQRQLSADKVREALRQQFDLGQRTLLDVLDTENEYFVARRTYLNGEMDLAIAQMKYLAASGNLLKTFKLKALEAEPPQPQTALDEDARNHCPPEVAWEPPPPPPNADYVALLENPDGTTGKVIIKGGKGEQVIDQARHGAPLDGSKPAAPVGEELIKRDFAEAMAARPPLPEQMILYFRSGSTTMTAESLAVLPNVIESIARHPAAEILIVGHTDTRGPTRANDALGMKRANVVVRKIKERGLKVQTLTVESRGERELLIQTPDNTAEPRNRRVRISIR